MVKTMKTVRSVSMRLDTFNEQKKIQIFISFHFIQHQQVLLVPHPLPHLHGVLLLFGSFGARSTSTVCPSPATSSTSSRRADNKAVQSSYDLLTGLQNRHSLAAQIFHPRRAPAEEARTELCAIVKFWSDVLLRISRVDGSVKYRRNIARYIVGIQREASPV